MQRACANEGCTWFRQEGQVVIIGVLVTAHLPIKKHVSSFIKNIVYIV